MGRSFFFRRSKPEPPAISSGSNPIDSIQDIPKSGSDHLQIHDDPAYHSTNSGDDDQLKSTLPGPTSQVAEETKPPGFSSSKEVEPSSLVAKESPGTPSATDPDIGGISSPGANKEPDIADHTFSTESRSSSSQAQTKPKTADSTTPETSTSSAGEGSEIPDLMSCKHEKSSASSADEVSAPATTHSEDNRSKMTDTKSSQNGDATCSNMLPTLDKTDNGDIEEDGPLPDVLYRTRVDDADDDEFRFYFSGEKFPEWLDPKKNETKPSASKLEIIRSVNGSWQGEFKSNRLKSMEEHQWRKKELHVDFKKQFKITKQHPPAMLINDPNFREVMKSIVKYDPSQVFTGDEIYIEWPWKMLMHYHEEIVNRKDKLKRTLSDDQATVSEVSGSDHDLAIRKKVESIDLVLKHIQDDYDILVAPELRNHTNSRVAEFAKLWLLFRPGEEVFANVNGRLAAFIVLSYRNHEPGEFATTHAPIKQFIVHVWNLRFVAGRLVRHMSQITIDTYEGTRLIETLPVYPCKYAGPKDLACDSRQQLIKKGKEYFKIIKQPHAYMEHKGLTRDEKPRKYNGRVIIDSISYVKYGPDGPARDSELDWEWLKNLRPKREGNSVHFEPVKPSDIKEPEDNGGGELWKKYTDIDPLDKNTEKPGFLEDLHYLLCPSIIRGFSLRDKQWETYDVNSLSPIDWESHDSPFSSLVLEEGKKEQIMANCRPAKSRQESPDLLDEQLGGKGAGTVVLLHGPPGVGKTYTVGCIANHTRQPLLSLSGCDMGSTCYLEQNVQHWFDLATAWDALVLLDEADIFLTYRQKNDMNRNLLVSVFLQAIESFPGMLFLATNRIGQLDTAINSRIDVDINFAKLKSESKETLWRQFFAQIDTNPNSAKGPYITEKCISKFLAESKVESRKLSGRDIRNVFKQATRMARYESLDQNPASQNFKIKPRHLIEAMKNCNERIEYILKANGVKSDEELAEKRFERQSSYPLNMKEGERVGP